MLIKFCNNILYTLESVYKHIILNVVMFYVHVEFIYGTIEIVLEN